MKHLLLNILIDIGKGIQSLFLFLMGLICFFTCLYFNKYGLPVFGELLTLLWDAI